MVNFMENEKIKVLISENQNMRSEIGIIAKTIHYCFFGFITAIGGIATVAVNLYKIGADNVNVGYLAFLVSQLETIFLIYYIMLMSDLAAKAAYIEFIETKINFLLNDNLVFWESKVSPFIWKRGSMALSVIILYIFYAIFFVLSTKYSYTYANIGCHLFLWIQIIEFLIICYLMLKLRGQKQRASVYISDLSSSKTH
jgi:hypothetical protein